MVTYIRNRDTGFSNISAFRLSKDTAPGPDWVKYSDIKNLSVDNTSELFRLYEESFSTVQVPED